jgi:hypothetical protein
MRPRTSSIALLVAALVLLAGTVAAVRVDSGLSSPPSPISGTDLTPALLNDSSGWDGLNYTDSCAACSVPDAQVAGGAGYVVEFVNASYEVWTTNGVLLTSGTLDTLFKAGMDTLADPQLRFDSTSLRWFASVDDLSKDQILYGGSETSDPTATWNIQHFNPAGGEIPRDSELGVDSLNLVVTTNLYSIATGTYLGAQVWVANKSQVIAGAGVNTWDSVISSSEQALVPAEALTASTTMYLVSDGTGNTTAFDLYDLTGSPPGTLTLSAATTFAINVSSPPNATQAGSAKLVAVGDGRVESAVWRSGTLWAAATDGCVPTGDTVLRSCLHLWEIDTDTETMEQNFNWSSGRGIYDFDPALSSDPGGSVLVVFGASSATMDPSVFASGQTSAGPSGTLEPVVLLKAGTGPDAPNTGCSGTVCPFGAYFGVAFAPFSGSKFWVAGEFTATDSTTDNWRTWIASVKEVPSYLVNFTESGLPQDTNWSVTLNGVTTVSNASSILYSEPNGSYSYLVSALIPGGPGVRYVADPDGGSFSVSGTQALLSIGYETQYLLTTSVTPATAGAVDPSSGWYNASSSVNIGALAESGYAFDAWSGTGPGSYSGGSNPAVLAMSGPISELASFVNSTTYRITVTVGGLPPGTPWEVSLNGLVESSGASQQTYNVTNGSYTYTVPSLLSGPPGVEYATNSTGGTFSVQGNSVVLDATYATLYYLTLSVSTAGEGQVSPASGWYVAGTEVNLSAIPVSRYVFASWTGSGEASYTGGADPATITMQGPVSEAASFDPAPVPTPPPSTSSNSKDSPTGIYTLIPLWALMLAIVAAVAACVLVFVASRRRRMLEGAGTPPVPVVAPAAAALTLSPTVPLPAPPAIRPEWKED